MTLGKKIGFALIELMVVVAVVSLFASFFVTRFLRHQIRERQEECHRNLHSLLEAEKHYFEKHNLFSTDLSELGWKSEGKPHHEYRFLPNPPPKNGFLFECSGNIDKDRTLDQATIDETGRLIQVLDDTKK